MNNIDHVADEVKRVLQYPNSERIYFAQQDRWIGYTKAQDALRTLNDLLDHPRITRMPNVLLVGDSGNGKTTIVEKFRDQHPVVAKPDGNPDAPIICMDMPSEPNESRFWSELLISLQIAHRASDPVQRKKNQAYSILEFVNCRMLVIDEIHNALIGHPRQQRHFLAVLRLLSNELRIPIVAVGIPIAINTLHTDTQLSSRFQSVGLPAWTLNQEFLRLLSSFEKLLPLRLPSNLHTKEIAIKLFNKSGGIIGELSKILKFATVEAIRSGEERINLKVLDSVNYVKLTDYGKQAQAI